MPDTPNTQELAATQPANNAPQSVMESMARLYGMDHRRFAQTLKATIMQGKQVSDEHVAAFCLVAKEHGLNPFTKEIFAFPSNGAIVPVVSVDGWLKLINQHPAFDGMEFVDVVGDAGKLVSVTCKMYRKDRRHPTEVTEYMAECLRTTDVWKKWPARMLRHKATIQAARYSFGFAGIMEPDEAERMLSVTVETDAKPALPDPKVTEWLDRISAHEDPAGVADLRDAMIEAFGDINAVPASVKLAFNEMEAVVMPRDAE
jgi:phage recombination protein Bet